MTDKQEMQLVAPLIVGAVFFVLVCLVWRRTGDLNRYTWKVLVASGGLVAYALYLTMWQKEISNIWQSFPFVAVFGGLLSLIIPGGLFYWIWRVQLAAKTEQNQAGTASARTLGGSNRLFRSIVLVWGTANLLGLLIAIIHSVLRQR